ncbi:hypothetical protein GCWU000325_02813 [Alloprevotella tannerae ATCC 51259]|uniref:Uncharacterized protein n=1 Tax=Alloprevotella tannerae ATCC 51259 TaxID=626522 RepID=C9LKP3_9BACT|nr:hypothetical protein GCWU000325_02813 [Alloprevotella tannerae ATCC 51259]
MPRTPLYYTSLFCKGLLLGAIAAYCLFPKKPCINVQRTIDTQLALF